MPRARDRWMIGGWLRGVRGRLVATYLLTALVLAAVGVTVFTLALSAGLRANVDAVLQTRARSLVADVAAGNIEHVDPLPTTASPSGRGLLAFTAVYAPGDRLVDVQPASVPAGLLSTGQQPRLQPAATATRVATVDGESFRVLAVPVLLQDGTWVVVAGENLSLADRTGAQVRQSMFVAVPILLALVGLGAWLLSGAALRPVDRMSADAQSLGEHDRAGRITEPQTRDSLNHLARTFNALLDRLHSSLDRQRALVADAGHELRTPLAVLQTELETAARPTRTRDDLVDSINHAKVEVARLAALSEDLLLLAQADGGQATVRRELTDIGAVVDDAVGAHQVRAEEGQITLTVCRAAELLGEVDPVALRRILDNLLVNAVRHTPAGGTVTVDADSQPRVHTTGDASINRQLLVRISDTGPGFRPDFLPKAFDRFSRSDQSRSRAVSAAGSGLGLAIVEMLVRAHSGTVTAANRPGHGAVVELRLPTASPDAAAV